MLSGLEPFGSRMRRRWSLDAYADWYLRCARALLLDPADPAGRLAG